MMFNHAESLTCVAAKKGYGTLLTLYRHEVKGRCGHYYNIKRGSTPAI